MSDQNLSNHAKNVPAFHYFALPVLTFNFGWTIYQWKTNGYTFNGIVQMFVAAALLVTLFLARIFALKVQDRVIRLEERLRYQLLLPDDLRSRIPEFTTNQLVSLRFASDAELPALARKVLTEGIKDRKSIKELIQNWKADYLRA